MYFNYNSRGQVVVYIDGACPGNGTRNARAGAGVFFGKNHPMNDCFRVPGIQSNNNAAIKAVEILMECGEFSVEIRTDSIQLKQSMMIWINRWKFNGWITSKGTLVANREMLEILDELVQHLDSFFITHVKGHNNNYGNDQADALARQGAYLMY